jgi:hypothetical protein
METSARPDTVPRMLEVADRPALISTKEAVRLLDCHVETLRRS